MFANALGIFLAKTLPVTRGEAVAWSFMTAFLFYAMAAMWVFAHQSLLKGCGYVWLAIIVLGLLSWSITIMGWRIE